MLLLLLALGLAAFTAGSFVPSVGAPIFAVVGGVLLSPLARHLASRAANRTPAGRGEPAMPGERARQAATAARGERSARGTVAAGGETAARGQTGVRGETEVRDEVAAHSETAAPGSGEPRPTTAAPRETVLGLAKGPVLRLSIVLLGAQLSLGEVASVGATSLPVMLGTLAVCLVLAWLIGRRLGIPRDLRTLIGVGTGICGASAIASVTPALRARSSDVAYAISTIFFFNVAAVLVFPPLGHLLGLDQQAFGLFAGTAVNDTSAVVAAATSYGPVAAQHAVVVKLVRTLMIIPVTLVLSKGARAPKPWFLGAFLLVAGAHTLGLVPDALQPLLHRLALLCIAVALAAVGLSTDVAALRRAGARPLLLGLILWIAVSATSLGLQHLTGL